MKVKVNYVDSNGIKQECASKREAEKLQALLEKFGYTADVGATYVEVDTGLNKQESLI